MVVSVAALQFPVGVPLGLEDLLYLFRRKPDFICLPEYFAVRRDAESHRDGTDSIRQQLDFYSQVSRDLQCVLIGGTIAHPAEGGFANIATVFDSGEPVGFYQKMNPTDHEKRRGIIPGDEYKTFDVRGLRIGVLICADVLTGDSFAAMADMGADMIFAPTVSPYRTGDTVFAKQKRDQEIFVAGARRASAYVVKTCGIGTIFGGRLQGRSGIFAPWGILKNVTPDSEDKKLVLTEALDIAEIREFAGQVRTLSEREAPSPALIAQQSHS